MESNVQIDTSLLTADDIEAHPESELIILEPVLNTNDISKNDINNA